LKLININELKVKKEHIFILSLIIFNKFHQLTIDIYYIYILQHNFTIR